jgi:hypothetical protein
MSTSDYKNEINSDVDHPTPGIFGSQPTLEDIKNKTNLGDYMTNNAGTTKEVNDDDNLVTTQTDLFLPLLVNDAKLRDSPEYYNKQTYGDNISNYLKNTNTNSQPFVQNSPSPQTGGYMSGLGSTANMGTRTDTASAFHHDTFINYQQTDDVNTIPNPSSYNNSNSYPTNVYSGFDSEEDQQLAKLDMLRKLGELTKYGVRLSQNYSMKSDYKSMKYEYELHKSIRDKQNGIKWMSNMFVNCLWGVELANKKFNPFDFRLKGWSEQMNSDIGSYTDVFGELYEKYFKTGKPIPPELKLFFMMSGSAVQFHLTNVTMGSLPNLSEMMKKNPSMAEKLREQAAAEKINKQNQSQRELFENMVNKNHETAAQKAKDIQMLKEKRKEHERMEKQNEIMKNTMLQQQMMAQQQKLDNLEGMLQAQMSENRSQYSGYQGQGQGQSQGQGQGQNSTYGSPQKIMSSPKIPPSLRGLMGRNNTNLNDGQQNFYRQQEIESQKKRMIDMENQKVSQLSNFETKSWDGKSVVNMRSDLDDVIDKNIRNGNSKIDELSTMGSIGSLESSHDSDGSSVKIKKKKRRRKNNIKIDA